MAVSGYKEVKVQDTFGMQTFLKFEWSISSQDRATNSTVINWSMIFYGKNGGFYSYNQTHPYSITIDGTNYTGTANVKLDMNESKTLASGSTTIKHDKNGAKTFSYSFSQYFGTEIHDYISSSSTGTLDIIPQPPPIVCTTTDIGSAPIITLKKYFSDFQQYEITYGFGNQELGYITGTIANTTTKTQIDDFVWPTSFYQVIPNSTSGKGTIFCKAYDKFYQLVGETTCEFTATANKFACTPTINPTITDTNSATVALTGDSSKLIRYCSTASITINAEAKNYATLVSQKAICGSNYFTTPTGAIGNIQSEKFSFEAVDSRGYKTTVGRDLKTAGRFVDYYLPTCVIGNNKLNTNGSMTVSCSGTWFNDSFGAVSNTLTAQYRYKVQDGSWSNWTSMSVSVYENTYEATANLTGLNYQNTYVFETRVNDKLTTVTSSEAPVVSLPIFHWSKEDFAFEVPVALKQGIDNGGEDLNIEGNTNVNGDITVEGEATIKGNLRLKGAGNYGNTIYFGDGSYVSFTEATDDDLTIKATDINFDTNNLLLRNQKIDFGSWTPKLATTAAVSSYNAQYGWYQRLGNVVTVGWQLKANINSGYQGTLIKITGLPFAPLYAASGGGICSGVYVSAGFNFECWAIDTDGGITGRVQACNNTSAANLNTSASGLFYRSGSGEISLGGTITYLINS